MTFLIDVLFAALVVVNLCLAGVGRLWGAVRLVAFQGLVIGLLPFVLTGEHALIAVVNVLVKGVLLPMMLNYAIRKARTVRELEPLVGFGKSVAIVFAVTLLSFRFAPETLAVAVSFATIATGLFLIIARRKAITQVIGFLVFENGISIFAAGISMDYGLVVELGILLDVFVLVFILGIAVYEINRTFSSIDIDKLNRLGDTRFMHAHRSVDGKGVHA